MASTIASRQCSQCKDAAGVFKCPGCKKMFCMKDGNKHRLELSTEMEDLMTEQSNVLKQMQDTEAQKRSLKQRSYDQIDDWQNTMIEQVRQRAEEIRQQVDELIDSEEEALDEDMQSLMDEIRMRREKDDFFEDDIERIRQNIQKAQHAIGKPIEQPDIELHTKPTEEIDWGNSIYIQGKSHAASSSDETLTLKLPSYDLPIIRPSNGLINVIHLPANIHRNHSQTPSSTNGLPNLANQRDKRERKPLIIVDPVFHKCVEIPRSSAGANVSESSSTETEKIQLEFRQQVARLLNGNYDA